MASDASGGFIFGRLVMQTMGWLTLVACKLSLVGWTTTSKLWWFLQQWWCFTCLNGNLFPSAIVAFSATQRDWSACWDKCPNDSCEIYAEADKREPGSLQCREEPSKKFSPTIFSSNWSTWTGTHGAVSRFCASDKLAIDFRNPQHTHTLILTIWSCWFLAQEHY